MPFEQPGDRAFVDLVAHPCFKRALDFACGGNCSTLPRDAQRASIAEEAGHFLLASAQLTGMIQQHIFASQDVPERFKCQILSFVRIQ